MSEWFPENMQEEQQAPVEPVAPQNDPPAPEVQPVPTEQSAQPAEQSASDAPTMPAPDWRANPYANGQPDAQNGWYRNGPVNNPQQNGEFTPNPITYAPPPPQKKGGKGGMIAIAVIGVIAIVLLTVLLVKNFVFDNGVGLLSDDVIGEEQDEVINDNAPTLDITDWADDDGGLSATEIINENMDSTVVINVYQMQVPTGMFQYGFGSETLVKSGEATGIVMTADGYIITNWHVVIDENSGEPFDQIDVVLSDGTVYENAQVIGSDQSTDLAIIKVNAKNLKTAEFGDSSKLVMGARVVTLGNAGGLQWSASQGIISGLARDVYEDTGYSIKCLQTDAAINPGNSGGPLLNNNGQVVGINSAKIAAEGYEGLGFSIPINEAKKVIDDLVKYGYVRGRVELGITGYSIANNGYYGFVIKTIEKGSMLENTKARAGDLITAIDGVKIDGYGALRNELSKHTAGDEVTLSLLRLDSRSGKTTTFEVTCKLRESKPVQ